DNGVRASNYWREKSRGWTYYDKNGVAVNGWQTIDGKAYYFVNYYAVTGWRTIGDDSYYFNSDGVMQTGWLKLDNGTFYLDAYGRKVKDWQTIGGKKYYFDYYGVATGVRWIENVYYYFDDNGVMKTDCWSPDGTQYFRTNGQALKEGIYKIGSKSYIFKDYFVQYNSNASLGLYYYDGNYYRINEDGSLFSGWYFHKDSTRSGCMYFDNNFIRWEGAGWARIGNKVYYFTYDHFRIQDRTLTIYGVDYIFGPDGVCKNPPAGV
ncbi:MAG: hypothetical protein IKT14_01805, partial [Clostridiales bacterium]|nr:hypothetical protein [Clostridiales bacterium]